MKILMRLQDRDLKLHIERVIRLLVGTRMWHLCAKLLASSLSNANSAFEKKKLYFCDAKVCMPSEILQRIVSSERNSRCLKRHE